MRRTVLVLWLAVSAVATAEAQTGKHFSLGGGIGAHNYSDSRFESKEFGFVPMYRFSKGGEHQDGWSLDMKTSVGMSNISVPSELAGTDARLGKLRTIPLFVGLGPAYRQGPTKLSAWVTGGPSFNNFEIDDGARAAYQAAGSSLDAVHAKTSWALKPGVSASYDLTSWLALKGSISYTINRPTVLMRINDASTSETWKLDHSSADVGLVLGIL